VTAILQHPRTKLTIRRPAPRALGGVAAVVAMMPLLLASLVVSGAHGMPVVVAARDAAMAAAATAPDETAACAACIAQGGGHAWCVSSQEEGGVAAAVILAASEGHKESPRVGSRRHVSTAAARGWCSLSHEEDDNNGNVTRRDSCSRGRGSHSHSLSGNRGQHAEPSPPPRRVTRAELCLLAQVVGAAEQPQGRRRVLLHDVFEEDRYDGNGTKLDGPSTWLWKTYHKPFYKVYRYLFYGYCLVLLVGYLVVISWCAKSQQVEGGFSTKITACCDDCGVCCFGCWCPCIEWGRMAEYLLGLRFKFGCCIYFGCSSSGPTRGVAGVLLGMVVRKELRDKLHIPGTIVEDCCIHCFAHGCAMCQEWREMQARRDAGTLPPPHSDLSPASKARWNQVVATNHADGDEEEASGAPRDDVGAARHGLGQQQQPSPADPGPEVQTMHHARPKP
jgi:Cys-rich protein (TIGR01571 family)